MVAYSLKNEENINLWFDLCLKPLLTIFNGQHICEPICRLFLKKNLSQRSSPVILCLRAIYYFRFYSKFDKRREKQKRQDDEESVEDVDDDEFERALGKVVGFFAVTIPVFPAFANY